MIFSMLENSYRRLFLLFKKFKWYFLVCVCRKNHFCYSSAHLCYLQFIIKCESLLLNAEINFNINADLVNNYERKFYTSTKVEDNFICIW